MGNHNGRECSRDSRDHFQGDSSKPISRNGLVQPNTGKNMEFQFSVDGTQCKDKNAISKRSGMDFDGATLVGLQVGSSEQRKDQCCLMEEYASAISNSKLMRIRPKALTDGEEDTRASSYIEFSDREQEHHADTRERILQGDDALDRMELERGGSIPPSS